VAPAEQSTLKIVKSPMPGALIKITVKIGDEVKKGAMLCIVEAMKMEVKLELI
jgi:biotin carboxyl carrier protein